jgi:lysozyme family protein
VTRLVSGLRSFALFWWDFIVGDDWRIAAGVVLALAGTAAIAATSVPAWWLLPIAVAALLAVSLWRATRTRP